MNISVSHRERGGGEREGELEKEERKLTIFILVIMQPYQ